MPLSAIHDPTISHNVAAHVRSEAIASALQPREWTLHAKPRGHARHIVLLSAGSGEIIKDNRVIQLEAPSVTWIHATESPRFKIQAGANGHLLGVSHEILAGAFGNHAESANLRYMIDQTFSLSLQAREKEALQRSCSAIDHELRHGGRASWMLLGAHFSLIAIEIWRLSGAEDVALRSQGGTSAILQRFRQLVENHFRNHWSISEYADAIGISPDRLHAICTRKLERKPLDLVHERLCHEGMLLLERSSLTVEQIAHALGFKDASHFSHFFKRRTSLPPSRYRQNLLGAEPQQNPASAATYADWP